MSNGLPPPPLNSFAPPTDSNGRVSELIALGAGPDLDAAERAELEALLADNPEYRAEFEAYVSALTPLRALRLVPDESALAQCGPMPANLADRVTAAVLATTTANATNPHARGADEIGPEAEWGRVTWVQWVRHPAAAAMVLLAVGLGLLLLPDRRPSTSEGDGGAVMTDDDGHRTGQPDANVPPSVPPSESVHHHHGPREIPIPVPIPGERARNVDGEALNAVATRNPLDMGLPFGLRTIESDREAGRIRQAIPHDSFGQPAAPNSRPAQFGLPQSDIAPDDTNIVGSF